MHVTHYVDFLKKNSLLKRINISTNQVAILFSFEQVPKKNDNTQSKGEISMNIRKWNCNHEAYDANERINCSSAIVSIKSRLQQSFVFRVPIKTAKTQVHNSVVHEQKCYCKRIVVMVTGEGSCKRYQGKEKNEKHV